VLDVMKGMKINMAIKVGAKTMAFLELKSVAQGAAGNQANYRSESRAYEWLTDIA
jgi:hypothetical protein